MRLLNTTTKQLKEFGVDPRRYAILSHRWLKEEVEFKHMSRPDVTQMKGYAKLSAACDMAHRLGFDYLWMDTCCIDKSSSSELSETINSMYTWYKEAVLCIVYLNDVDQTKWQIQFAAATWFTRGWTLQELIAPGHVLFVDKHWNSIGTKSSLARQIASITNIDEYILLTGDMKDACVAKKMSWAAKRKTTRPEDMAYSLMGIFDVNMPTIYGERDKAFIRLQEEIMKKSSDQSIFAWKMESDSPIRRMDEFIYSPFLDVGLLAEHPSCFASMSNIAQTPITAFLAKALNIHSISAEFTQTNCGIRIQIPKLPLDRARTVYVALIPYGDPTASGGTTLAIPLREVSPNQFTRFRVHGTRSTDLVEVPLSIPLSRIRMHEEPSSIVIAAYKSQYMSIVGSDPSVCRISVTHLFDRLRTWGLTLCDKSAKEEVKRNSTYFKFLSSTKRDMVFAVKNESKTVEFMLAVTFNILYTKEHLRIDRVDVRAIMPAGPDGGIPDRTPALDSSVPPQVSIVKLSNGEEIGFSAAMDHSFKHPTWSILAIPQTSSSESVIGPDF